MPLTRETVVRSTGLLTWVKSFRDFSGFMSEDIIVTLCTATAEAETQVWMLCIIVIGFVSFFSCLVLTPGHIEVVKLLASHGAEVACKDKKSYTPLHAAASSGMISVVKYLLDSGVDVSSTYSVIVFIALTLLDLRRYYISIHWVGKQ